MTNPIERARAHFSAIQITMVSIVVALALQEWLERLPEVERLWQMDAVAVRLWCQALVALLIIVKMWTGFVLAAAVTARVPTPIDLLGPFGILVFVDAQIESIDVAHAARWWAVLGIGSLIAAWFIARQSFYRSEGRPPSREGEEAPAETTLTSEPGVPAELGTLPGVGFVFGNPAVVESFIGVASIAAALWHVLAVPSGAAELVACALMLAIQAASAVGPIMGWRVLRRVELSMQR